MWRAWKQSRGAWLIVGIFAGMFVGSFLPGWPDTPLHAVATDRHENFAIATGALDEDIEAVYFLDFLTGDLMGAALGIQSGKFIAFYKYNILGDFQVDVSKNPRFLMVTGFANLVRGGARFQPANSVIYIAELTSGKVGAYSIPWDPTSHRRNQPFTGTFVLLDVKQFRNVAIREQE